jgi:hypothetical protein
MPEALTEIAENKLITSILPDRRPDSFDTVAQHRLGERETQIIF